MSIRLSTLLIFLCLLNDHQSLSVCWLNDFIVFPMTLNLVALSQKVGRVSIITRLKNNLQQSKLFYNWYPKLSTLQSMNLIYNTIRVFFYYFLFSNWYKLEKKKKNWTIKKPTLSSRRFDGAKRWQLALNVSQMQPLSASTRQTSVGPQR